MRSVLKVNLIGATIDKLTVLGDIKSHKDVFLKAIEDLGFELMEYKSRKYGYTYVYVHQLNGGLIEIASERKNVDYVDIERRKIIISGKLQTIKETGINNTGQTLNELQEKHTHLVDLLATADERGYIDRLKDVRYEFNPKYHNYVAGLQEMCQSVISSLEKIKISSIHIALDYDIDINYLQLTDTKSRKETWYLGTNKQLETRYFGARSSRNQVVVYNKKQENEDNDTVDQYPETESVTRFEARLKNNYAAEFITGKFNPFEGLMVEVDKVKSLKLDRAIKTSEKAMIAYFLANPEELLNEPTSTQTRWKKKIRELVQQSIDLATDYETEKKSLVGELGFLIKQKIKVN